jgi:NADH:ubiquinone oxidoreductase subunit E
MDREQAIDAITKDTGKTREQAEAFLDIARSAFQRRGWVDGEPLRQDEIAERLDTFIDSPGEL